MRRSTQCAAVLAAFVVAAGPIAAQDDDSLERCEQPLGTIAVLEPQDATIRSLNRYGLDSPTSLIRMMIQHSNCFTVVERGAGLSRMQQERQLARSGELQQGSNMGGGQMLAADFLLTPNVIFSEGNAGGIGGAIGGLVGGAVGGALAGLKFKEAQTSMLVGDVRTGTQVLSAEGHAKKTDFRLGALGIGPGVAAAVGAYSNTNEGKVIAASFLDNYNRIVADARNNPALLNRPDALAGPVFNEGDVVRPKIDNVKLLAEPTDAAASVATVGKSSDLVYLGAENEGFLQVQGSAGMGWVKKILVVAAG